MISKDLLEKIGKICESLLAWLMSVSNISEEIGNFALKIYGFN